MKSAKNKNYFLLFFLVKILYKYKTSKTEDELKKYMKYLKLLHKIRKACLLHGSYSSQAMQKVLNMNGNHDLKAHIRSIELERKLVQILEQKLYKILDKIEVEINGENIHSKKRRINSKVQRKKR